MSLVEILQMLILQENVNDSAKLLTKICIALSLILPTCEKWKNHANSFLTKRQFQLLNHESYLIK